MHVCNVHIFIPGSCILELQNAFETRSRLLDDHFEMAKLHGNIEIKTI